MPSLWIPSIYPSCSIQPPTHAAQQDFPALAVHDALVFGVEKSGGLRAGNDHHERKRHHPD